jgi:hypothetical protein
VADEAAKSADRGRPTLYTEAVAAEVCSRLATGETLRCICKDEHIPAASTVIGWALEDREGFSERYARAREMQREVWADEITDISDDGSNDWMKRENKDGSDAYLLNGEHVQRSKLRVDSRKWLLSKLEPKKYGDRTHIEATGKDGKDLIPEKRDDLELARFFAGILTNAAKQQETPE